MGAGRNCLILTFPMLGSVVALALTIVMLLGSTKQASGLKDVYFMRVDMSNITDTPIEGLNDATGGLAASAINSVVEGLGISQIYDAGVSGYCEGTKKDDKIKYKCHNGDLPYWFDLQTIVKSQLKGGMDIKFPDKVKDYEKILRTACKAMWICFVIGAVVSGVTVFVGLFSFHSRMASICTTFISIVAFIALFLSAGLGTGIYKTYSHYFNDEVSKYGIKASLNGKAVAISWVAVAASLWATVWWVASICCCGSTHRKINFRGFRGGPAPDDEKEPFIGYVPQQNPHQPPPHHAPHY